MKAFEGGANSLNLNENSQNLGENSVNFEQNSQNGEQNSKNLPQSVNFFTPKKATLIASLCAFFWRC